jgi:hypothetical protein
MDYEKVTVKKLADISTNSDALLHDIAVLLAKTGLYEPSCRINHPERDPFEVIIEKFILPDIDRTFRTMS